jgi:hypothetical protein
LKSPSWSTGPEAGLGGGEFSNLEIAGALPCAPPTHFAPSRWSARFRIAQNPDVTREMVFSVLYDVSTGRGVRLADVDACGGVSCLLRTLATGSLRPQATLMALDLLKQLTRTFSLDMVDRVLALDGPRVVAGVLAAWTEPGRHTSSSGRSEIVSRSLLLLCRWAALSPSRLQDVFDDFWKVLLGASRPLDSLATSDSLGSLGSMDSMDSLDSSNSFDSLYPMDERQRHLAYAFCGVCVLSVGDASKLAGLCVELEENMCAVCRGLEAYRGRFPCDRLPRAVVTAMMTLHGDALVGRALQVEGMSFLRAGGEMAGAAILRGARSPDGAGRSGLADFVATSVGAAGVFHADTDADARKRIVCELLEDELCGDCPAMNAPSTSSPGLQKETSVDSIVLMDALLCGDSTSKSRTPSFPRMRSDLVLHHAQAGRGDGIGGKRGLQLISEAYARHTREAQREHRPLKRVRRVRQTKDLTIRIGRTAAIAVGDRGHLSNLVGVVSLFEDDGGETLDLPDALPGTVPDKDRFARACTEVLRFLTERAQRARADEDHHLTYDSVVDTDEDLLTYDCWIVADYLGVDCDPLYAALYRVSTAETIERLVLRFPHLAPTVARCTWRVFVEGCDVTEGVMEHVQRARTEGGEHQGRDCLKRASPVTGLLIEGVYDHLCETLCWS